MLLRRKLPHIAAALRQPPGQRRRRSSPALIALVTLVTLFLNPDYRVGIYGCVAWYAAGLIYFAVYGRKTLVYSPEEDFAVKAQAGGTSGNHG